MNTGNLTGAGRVLLPILCIMNLLLILCPMAARGDLSGMRNYCDVPPLAGTGVNTNLLLMVDNSASMYDLAYTNPATYCIDDSIDTYEKAGTQYAGYFDPSKLYSYNFTNSDFETASSQTMPTAPCSAAQTSYLCANVTSGKLDNLLASGNFLNWLTTSKLDIEKKALTGGNYDPTHQWLQSETRGCQGKGFIKMVGNSPVTFAVRGPLPGESDYVYRASYGGFTKIDVYASRYNKDPCLAAVKAWQDGVAVSFTAAAQACLNNQYDPPPHQTVPSKGYVFTQIMSDCYLAKGNPLSADTALISACNARYSAYYPQPSLIPASAGDEVCGANFEHNGGYSSTGFLGNCYGRRGLDTSCVGLQMTDFCNEMVTPTLTDPSASPVMAGTNANLPGFILDAGITNLGTVSATVRARVATGSAPTGLIQEFGSAVNFGAMVFNNSGAGSECSTQQGKSIPCVRHCQNDPAPQNECYQDKDCTTPPCVQDSLSDGGMIISYINHTLLGDHTPGSGLVASIDAVVANSWTPLAESFYDAIGYFANRTDLRLQAADFDATWPPSQFACQRNNILIVTDGMSTADRAGVVNSYVANGLSGYTVDATQGMPALQTTKNGDPVSTAPPNQGSYNLDDLAWIANHKNIADWGKPIVNKRDFISTYVVYTGPPCGSYDANHNCTTSDEGVPEKMMQLTAFKGGGKIANAQNPADLETALRGMLTQIGTSTNSGTGASILSTGTGNGAIFLQEEFYQNKSFDSGLTSASWIGEMQSLWYYIDPFIGSKGGASSIREDTGALLALDLKRDRVVQFGFDAGQNAQANLYLDADGDGNIDPVQPAGYPLAVSPDAVQSLWRAGLQLWKRDPATRTIYTQTDGQNLIGLSASDLNQQQLMQASGPTDAGNIVSYVQGVDTTSTRNRSIYADGTGTMNVWKLGDIISSTPALQSAVSLGSYNIPAPQGYGDASYSAFINSSAYQHRGTVYVGANDGMLHAFRLGSLQLQRATGWPSSQKATLSGTELGKEEWAFVPKNALPYLRYLQDPNYPHLYYVDGSTTLADVSLGDPASCSRGSYWNCPKDSDKGTNWRTVLISGMGLGGASRGAADSCVEGASGTCVRSPQQTAGFSSYFALDVTGQSSDGTGPAPKLLWEFSPPGLGFATSGAAIVKLNAQTGTNPVTHDHDKNGRWFAVFASGPTGSIDSGSCQFQGVSDQNLKLFVVDLNAVPPLTQGGNYWVIDTGIPFAFGGSMSGAGIDTDRWNVSASGFYEDNALYVGYTGKASDGTWTTGGVLRLLTGENLDPSQWVTSKVIDGIGPVTGAVSKLQDRKNHNLWLYFGTGRYFFNQDDMAAGRALFGVKEPCYTANDTLPADSVSVAACGARTPLALSDLSNAPDSAPPGTPSPPKGWWIGLDAAAGAFGSERLTANPTALTGGAVSYTSFKPSTDRCQQGASYLWVVKYDSGGSASLNGKAIVPLSNGSSAESSLANWTDRGGRRGPQMTGKPGGVKLITNSGLKPLKKIIHIQER